MSKEWMLFDLETGNAIDATDVLHVAGEWWVASMSDPTLGIVPDIDCEGDCCPHNECRFGLKGGPSTCGPQEEQE